eukprot:2174602-Rhodomonas_salina.2
MAMEARTACKPRMRRAFRRDRDRDRDTERHRDREAHRDRDRDRDTVCALRHRAHTEEGADGLE